MWFSHFYFCTLYLSCTLLANSFLLFVYKFLILIVSVSPYASYSSLYLVDKFYLSAVLSHPSYMLTPLQHVSFHALSFIFTLFLNSILHLFAHIYFQISKKLIVADLNCLLSSDLVLQHSASKSNVLLKYCKYITNDVSWIFGVKTPTSRCALFAKSVGHLSLCSWMQCF